MRPGSSSRIKIASVASELTPASQITSRNFQFCMSISGAGKLTRSGARQLRKNPEKLTYQLWLQSSNPINCLKQFQARNCSNVVKIFQKPDAFKLPQALIFGETHPRRELDREERSSNEAKLFRIIFKITAPNSLYGGRLTLRSVSVHL